MNKTSKKLVTSILILSLSGILASAYAMPPHDSKGPGNCMRGEHKAGPGGRGFNVDRMAEKLKLSNDQRTQIESIINESKDQLTEFREKMQGNRKQLRALTQTATLNEADVRKIADAQGDLKADMIVLRVQQRAKINSILTEDQRAKLKEMRGKRR